MIKNNYYFLRLSAFRTTFLVFFLALILSFFLTFLLKAFFATFLRAVPLTVSFLSFLLSANALASIDMLSARKPASLKLLALLEGFFAHLVNLKCVALILDSCYNIGFLKFLLVLSNNTC